MERDLSPSKHRIKALSEKLNSMQVGLEHEKAARTHSLEARLKALDEKVQRTCNKKKNIIEFFHFYWLLNTNKNNNLALAEETKFKLLKDQVSKLHDALSNERTARELLDERKTKELKLLESSVTLDLNVERQGRKDRYAE